MRQALDTGGADAARAALVRLVDRFGRDNVAVELTHELDPLADERYEVLAALAEQLRLELVTTTAAHYHGPPRRPLATALAAVRARSSLDEIDGWLPAWAGQHLRSGAEMAARFARWPSAVAATARLAKEIAFPLELIAPDLPPFPCPPGHTEMSFLRELTYRGAGRVVPRQGRTRSARTRCSSTNSRSSRTSTSPATSWSSGRSRSSAARAGSCARDGDRRPTPRSVTRCRSPPSTPSTTT